MEMPEIWVIHYDKLKERKLFLKKQLKEQNIKANWFIQRQSNPYSQDQINEYYSFDKKIWRDKIKIAKKEIIPRKLGINEISLTMNHFKLWENFSKFSEDKIFLVLEDDIIFEKDFNKKLSLVLNNLKNKKWDICFLDWCASTPPALKKPLEFISKRKDLDSWGTAAYLIKPLVCKKLLSLRKFNLCIDDELKYRVKKLDLNDVWVNPPLTKQGSIYSGFKSCLEEERENAGIKKYLKHRRKLYLFLDKIHLNFLTNLFIKIELKLKKRIIK